MQPMQIRVDAILHYVTTCRLLYDITGQVNEKHKRVSPPDIIRPLMMMNDTLL